MTNLPWPVHLVSHAPVFDTVRLLVSVRTPQLAPPGSSRDIAVLDECGRVLYGPGAEVEPEKWLGGHQPRPCDEFVSAELIGLQRIPGAIENGRPVFLGTDAIQPVITGYEISAGVANDGHSKVADLLHDIGAESVAVGEFRPRIVDALVNGASQVLQKRAEEVTVNRTNLAGRIDDDTSRALALCHA